MKLDKEYKKLIKMYAKKLIRCEAWFIPEDQSCLSKNCPYHRSANENRNS